MQNNLNGKKADESEIKSNFTSIEVTKKKITKGSKAVEDAHRGRRQEINIGLAKMKKKDNAKQEKLK